MSLNLKISQTCGGSVVAMGIVAALGGTAHADLATTASAFDRWNYPFNSSPGSRGQASTFGAVGSEAFDERDAQLLLGFDLSGLLPALDPGQSIQLNSVTVQATHSTGTFIYDPTYDAYQTYLPDIEDPNDTNSTIPDPNFIADSDAGRPVILTGAGLRSGYAGFTFGSDTPGAPPFTYEEDEAFGFGDPTVPNVRTAFAAAFDGSGQLIDISNNVSEGFDVTPFAVGTTNVAPGTTVDEAGAPGGTEPGSTFDFDLNLADAAILSYVQQGIDDNALFFSISSLHAASRGGTASFPNFYTKDSFDPAAIAPQLLIDFTVVPEPVSGAILFSLIGLTLTRSRDPRCA